MKQKVAKNSSQQEAFAAQGLMRCKPARTWAGIFSPYFVRALPPLQQKFPMPCSRTRPPLFCPLSPEAFADEGEDKNQGNQIISKICDSDKSPKAFADEEKKIGEIKN